ncbi:MAG: Crp/Fnr family transcriptional regulator [Chromatiales bacterium]|nr:Crp/Fnr family transcriptional regulator [Chromatiales bacterium]
MTLTARAVLKANRLFRDLPDPTLDQLAGLAVRRSVKRGQRIFAEGDPGDSLMGLISGQVRISATTPAGQEVFLNLLESGDSFGEIAVLDGNARTANAEAVTDVELFVVRRVDLMALVGREPRLAAQLIALLCKRLRWTSDLIEESAFLSLPARLARRLVKMAEDHGSTVAGGIELRISQAELAGFLSVSRQVVNQQLQAWRKKGWVEVGRGRVVVRDVKGLAGIVG